MKKMNVRFTAALAAVMIAAGAPAVPAFAVQRDSVPGSAREQASSARAVRERDSQTMNSQYLLPDSDTYYITEADISWMDDNELMMARNEFYARRGRKFATKSIQDYFNRQGWYEGTIEPDAFTSEMFNRYEQANVDFIVTYEKKRKEIRQQKERKPVNGLADSNPTADKGDERYGEILSLYGDAVHEGWTEEEVEYAGVNRMVTGVSVPEELGYLYRDLDGDGNGELLIGPTDTQKYGEGAVFDIYRIDDDGIPVQVASSDEGCAYYVCEDNTIRREMTGDDGRWEIDYLDLNGGELVCKDMLVMDESKDTEEPWFVVENIGEMESGGLAIADGNDRMVDEEGFQADYEPISYEDASELRASYVGEALDYTAFK